MNGILLIDKPEGLSSAAVVRLVKKTLKVDKIGHLGTLDPFASGLLPLCVGTGTKIAQFLMESQKSYSGVIRLGAETNTMDAAGIVTRIAPFPHEKEYELRELENRFIGDYWQTPPMYSALKRNGVPLYKLARQGVVIEREPRKVRIERFSLIALAPGFLSFFLTCSKGAYVRVLAADIGGILGCGAHLVTLRRLTFGRFNIADALPLRRFLDEPGDASRTLLSPTQVMRYYQAIRISSEAVAQLRRGQQEILNQLPDATNESAIAALFDPVDELVAVVENRQNRWRLARVF